MSLDTRLFILINGLAGRVPFFDGLFQGISNDYFSLILSCLILVALWFGIRDARQREVNQKAILTAAISIAVANIIVAISNAFYFRVRPFNALPPESVHLIFYRPHDSSFPSNFASVMFALSMAVFIRNNKWGGFLLALAAVTSLGRVYVGVHYPLDILGGAAIGTVSSFLAYGLTRLFHSQIDYLFGFLRKLFLA